MTNVYILNRREDVEGYLSKRLGKKIKLQKTKKGKPYIDYLDKNISIAHKHEHLVIAMSDRPVGVDIERVIRKKSHKKIAKRYFAPSEVDVAAGTTFFELWTRKEALGKLVGEGLNIDILKTEVAKEQIIYKNKSYYAKSLLNVIEDYCVTVVSEENNVEIAY